MKSGDGVRGGKKERREEEEGGGRKRLGERKGKEQGGRKRRRGEGREGRGSGSARGGGGNVGGGGVVSERRERGEGVVGGIEKWGEMRRGRRMLGEEQETMKGRDKKGVTGSRFRFMGRCGGRRGGRR